MNNPTSLSLADKIHGPAYEHWYTFLRQYPSVVKEIIESVPAATTVMEARRRTVALWQWLQHSRMELCNLISDVEDDTEAQAFGIEFGGRRHGTHDPPSQMGRRYFDPLFLGRPMGSLMSGGLYTQRHWGGGELVHTIWDKAVRQAETAWFGRIEAPLVVLCGFGLGAGSNETLEWDATSKIVSLLPQQRSLDGWHDHFPIHLLDALTPPDVREHHGRIQLSLKVHAPSPLLMAQRQADRLSGDTAEATHPSQRPRL